MIEKFWFLAVFGGAPSNLDGLLSFDFPIPTEISANHSADRSGDSGERRKHLKSTCKWMNAAFCRKPLRQFSTENREEPKFSCRKALRGLICLNICIFNLEPCDSVY